MPVRQTWVLVLLAAVFLMHAIPSLVLDPTLRPVAGPAGHSEVVSAGHGAGHMPGAPSPHLAGESAAVPDDGSSDGRAPAHSPTAHAWAACLAVLAGIALLGIAVLGRWWPAGRERALPRPRLHRTGATLPRPPDLFALCLLRT